ncbi:hypothetical protein ACO2Q8_17840 [Larkinella sp. VNQ87]|uniref:hypothetical protein n=1 Tax=Larkinella sp. VNQ87 TaxID=3400921 RepID=UPI003C12A0D5
MSISANADRQQNSPVPPTELPEKDRPPSRLDKVLLADLYGGDWPFIQEQYAYFQEEWPVYRQEMTTSLTNGQSIIFGQQVHKFSSSLFALGITRTADRLKLLSERFDQLTAIERSVRWADLVQEVEEAISEMVLEQQPG